MNQQPQAFASSALPTPDDLSLGTHFVTPRLGYLHHGIYAGNGRVNYYSGFFRRFRAGMIKGGPVARSTGRRSSPVTASVSTETFPTPPEMVG
jgi:hypothetical protein